MTGAKKRLDKHFIHASKLLLLRKVTVLGAWTQQTSKGSLCSGNINSGHQGSGDKLKISLHWRNRVTLNTVKKNKAGWNYRMVWGLEGGEFNFRQEASLRIEYRSRPQRNCPRSQTRCAAAAATEVPAHSPLPRLRRRWKRCPRTFRGLGRRWPPCGATHPARFPAVRPPHGCHRESRVPSQPRAPEQQQPVTARPERRNPGSAGERLG